MKKLIINADDLGADMERNAGIFEAIDKGVVTSVSILPNGPAFDDAVRLMHSIKGKYISCGLHINLSEGKPITRNLRTLTSQDGNFLGKSSAIRLLKSELPKNHNQTSTILMNSEWNRMGSCESVSGGYVALSKEIYVEIQAQMKKLIDSGIHVEHIDGHHHIHIFPSVVESVVDTAREFNITWIRTPEESRPSCYGLQLSNQQVSEANLFSQYAASARKLMKKSDILTTSHFRGLYFKGKFSIDIFEAMLRNLPDGSTELMLHPGRSSKGQKGSFSTFSTPEREIELEALLHPNLPSLLKKYGVILTSVP